MERSSAIWKIIPRTRMGRTFIASAKLRLSQVGIEPTHKVLQFRGHFRRTMCLKSVGFCPILPLTGSQIFSGLASADFLLLIFTLALACVALKNPGMYRLGTLLLTPFSADTFCCVIKLIGKNFYEFGRG